MLRYWQAFMSVKDSQYPHPVVRTLLVSAPTVQVRFSVLASTIVTSFAAIVAAVISRILVSRDTRTRSIHLPSSQFDWAVQAAREHHKSVDGLGSTRALEQHGVAFAAHNDDLEIVISSGPDDNVTTWIRSIAPEEKGAHLYIPINDSRMNF